MNTGKFPHIAQFVVKIHKNWPDSLVMCFITILKINQENSIEKTAETHKLWI